MSGTRRHLLKLLPQKLSRRYHTHKKNINLIALVRMLLL